MSIDFQRAEYEAYLPLWTKIQNIVDGENLTNYIYDLNPGEDLTESVISRNKHFKNRAVFYAAASYTVRGYLGMVYDTPPKIEIPTMEYLYQNIDGTGIGIEQQSQDVVNELIRVGRCGLWADYPDTGGKDVSLAEQRKRAIYSTVHLFKASDIFFWSTKRVGSEVVYDDIRLFANREKKEDLTIEIEPIIIRLFLDENGFYTVQNYVKTEAGWEPDGPPKMPTDGKGRKLTRIPFVFCGSESNTARIDEPPLNGIVRMNVAHYTASAYYWDSVRMVGQPQPWMSGIDASHATEMDSANIYLGSGVVIPVPPGEQFGIEQAEPNTLASGAMEMCEKQLISLGALFIQPGSATKTATQSKGEQKVQHSVLSLIAANVSDAYQQIMDFVAAFNNVELTDFVFELNQNYVQADADAQMLQAMINGFLQGAIPMRDFQTFLVKHQLSDEDTEPEEFAEMLASPGVLNLDALDASSTSGTV